MRNLQIETITTATGKQDVIRDIETVNAILKDNAQLEASLRLAVEALDCLFNPSSGTQDFDRDAKQLIGYSFQTGSYVHTALAKTLSTILANHPNLSV
jgi:hypothetical protein